MVRADIFLVPLDFSKDSERALDHALKLARETQARVTVLHVSPAEMIYPQPAGKFDLYGLMERDARENFQAGQAQATQTQRT